MQAKGRDVGMSRRKGAGWRKQKRSEMDVGHSSARVPRQSAPQRIIGRICSCPRSLLPNPVCSPLPFVAYGEANSIAVFKRAEVGGTYKLGCGDAQEEKCRG